MSNIKENILSRTSNGKDVFTHFFDIGKGLFLNKYRHDTAPSCKLYVSNGRYVMRDFGASEWCGDCFHVVGMIYNLDTRTQFMDIMKEIDKELSLFLFDSDGKPSDREPVKRPPIVEEKKEKLTFSLTEKKFTEEELDYWGGYGITAKVLSDFNVKSIAKCIMTKGDSKFSVFGNSSNPSYAYLFNGGKGIKVYRPFSAYRFIYAGDLPQPYVFGWDQLPESGGDVYITGGEKDVMSLVSHGFAAISFNSETANLPLSVIRSLSDRFARIILLYDCDETGKKESLRQLERLRDNGFVSIHRVILPLSGTKKEKDASDFFKLGHVADELREHVESIAKNI